MRSPETAGARPLVDPSLAPVEGAAEEEEELIMHLERDQFVAETSRPVPRARLTRGARIALWGLRVFAVVVSLMVIYTFIDTLH
ncbi:MAG: hypothetical protein ABSD82_02615 [Solirubrobacteraceae bacterium]